DPDHVQTLRHRVSRGGFVEWRHHVSTPPTARVGASGERCPSRPANSPRPCAPPSPSDTRPEVPHSSISSPPVLLPPRRGRRSTGTVLAESPPPRPCPACC